MRRETKKVKAYSELPETFSLDDIITIMNVTKPTAYGYASRWVTSGYVKRQSRGKFIKIVKIIV